MVTSPPRRLRFPRSARVLRKADFDRVYASRLHASDRLLTINAAANGLDHARLGLAVSRAVGPAVVRNRWKRRLREAFRRHPADWPAGFDFVVRPRGGTPPAFGEVVASLRRVTARVARQRGVAGT